MRIPQYCGTSNSIVLGWNHNLKIGKVLVGGLAERQVIINGMKYRTMLHITPNLKNRKYYGQIFSSFRVFLGMTPAHTWKRQVFM